VAINFGLRFKKPVDLFGHNTSHQMLLAAGLSAPLICGKLEAIGTMQVRTSLTKPFKSKYDNGLDLLGGLRGLAGPVGLTLVAGGGTLRGFGSPAFQITAGVEYSPKPCEKGCYVPPPDRDGDGIPDDEDECPDDPGLKEFNGCPDRDGDGIPDKDDECPDDPGLKEFNGCPDRDGDGIPDKDDACPDEPGIKKFNGCPDRDGDGIPDKDDECPDVPGVAEFKGCPPPKITVTEKKIEFEGTVFFDFEQATIKPESFPLLNALAKTMKENPQIKKVRVDGHTDSVGRDDFNLNLSQRRAAAVVDYMIAQGVEAERLASEGFGKSKPIADNATEEGRAKNRRVELTILEMAKSGDKPKGKK
jgi:outer membrane protein OmpA-like peptidoglycan-associated protein